MNLLEVDSNEYMFFDQKTASLKYRHKFLVPGTETKDLGMDEKWSKWTVETAREFAFSNSVNVIQSRSKRA